MDDAKYFELLKKVINQDDPLGLIDLDTPESLNEYDPEIKEILKKDIVSMKKEELGEWIYQVFISFFNEELVNKKDKYYSIAEKILKQYN